MNMMRESGYYPGEVVIAVACMGKLTGSAFESGTEREGNDLALFTSIGKGAQTISGTLSDAGD